jgi:hypothetical protein
MSGSEEDEESQEEPDDDDEFFDAEEAAEAVSAAVNFRQSVNDAATSHTCSSLNLIERWKITATFEYDSSIGVGCGGHHIITTCPGCSAQALSWTTLLAFAQSVPQLIKFNPTDHFS